MARTAEIDLPIARQYLELLRSEIEELGRGRIAKLANIDTSTVHRNVNDEALTYTTAMKLRDAIERARREDKAKGKRWVPPPFIPVVSQGHYDLCEIAGELHILDGDLFAQLFEKATELHTQAKRDHVLADANRRIAHPLRKGDDEDDRGD